MGCRLRKSAGGALKNNALRGACPQSSIILQSTRQLSAERTCLRNFPKPAQTNKKQKHADFFSFLDLQAITNRVRSVLRPTFRSRVKLCNPDDQAPTNTEANLTSEGADANVRGHTMKLWMRRLKRASLMLNLNSFPSHSTAGYAKLKRLS